MSSGKVSALVFPILKVLTGLFFYATFKRQQLKGRHMITPKYLIDSVEEITITRLQEHTIKLLKTTKRPKHAFVCYEIPKVRHTDGKAEVITGLITTTVEDQPNQIPQFEDIIGRGGKYICHGNFPTHNDADPLRAKKWLLYGDAGGSNPWDMVADHCAKQLGVAVEIDSKVKKFADQVLEAQKENKSLKEQLAKLTKDKTIKAGA